MLLKGADAKTAATESQRFWDYYGANGWRVGKNPMRIWKHAASGWLSRLDTYGPTHNGQGLSKQQQIEQRSQQTVDEFLNEPEVDHES